MAMKCRVRARMSSIPVERTVVAGCDFIKPLVALVSAI